MLLCCVSISAALLHFLFPSFALFVFLTPNIFILPCGPVLPLLYMKHSTLRGRSLWSALAAETNHFVEVTWHTHSDLSFLQVLHHHLKHLLLFTLHDNMQILNFMCNWYEKNSVDIFVLNKRGGNMMCSCEVEKENVFSCYVKPLTRYLCSSLPSLSPVVHTFQPPTTGQRSTITPCLKCPEDSNGCTYLHVT